ncbi:MAG: hypothetical protein GY805_19540 [Chloroflexi bacterium]|nr:hypothetical protein [Chloroflexota bacterium]
MTKGGLRDGQWVEVDEVPVWMRRWLETHRHRKAAREALARALANRPKQYRQLALDFL